MSGRKVRRCPLRPVHWRAPLSLAVLPLLGLFRPGPSALAAPPPFELVESWPVETSLDHKEIPDAAQVWKECFDSAQRTIDLAEFYVSDTTASALTPVLQSLEAAAARGVKVRFLADKKFHGVYPQILDHLGSLPGIEMRLYDVGALTGGVLHAKYFIVDGSLVYFGSQNFDWRSLSEIQELGARIEEPAIVRAFSRIFETDWALAAGGDRSTVLRERPEPERANAPIEAAADSFPRTIFQNGDTIRVSPVFSPEELLPAGSAWDLPALVAMIDSARTTVRVQLLTYGTTDREGRYFGDLEAALRRAAARGVSVQLLLSNWCQRKWTIEGLQSLEPLPKVEVRLMTIPQWSGGFIPYARVVHAKYLVVDGTRAWIGTGNWERDYFYASRNVGVILQSRAVGSELDRFFLDGWNSPYAKPVDPCATYQPPRIGG